MYIYCIHKLYIYVNILYMKTWKHEHTNTSMVFASAPQHKRFDRGNDPGPGGFTYIRLPISTKFGDRYPETNITYIATRKRSNNENMWKLNSDNLWTFLHLFWGYNDYLVLQWAIVHCHVGFPGVDSGRYIHR